MGVLRRLGAEFVERPITVAAVLVSLVYAAVCQYRGDWHGAQLAVLTALVMARKD